MIATSLLNQKVCFRLPPDHKGDAPNPLHKTEGTIKNVYLYCNAPRYTVLNQKGGLETCSNSQIVICLDILFKDAVRMIEKEDAER